MADRVLNQVEEDSLKLFGIAACGGKAVIEFGAHGDTAHRRVRSHRLDRLLHEFVEPDLLHRPADVSGFEPGELEQVVDQHAERAHVG